MDRWLASVLVFVFCIGVGYLWSSMMAKPSDENGRSPWSASNWFSGVTLVTVVGGAYWLGGVPGQVVNLGTQLAEMRTDMRAGFSALNSEVFQSDNSLKVRATRTEDTLNLIRPRLIREEFEVEIARLNQEIAKLREENQKLQKDVDVLRAGLAESEKNRQSTTKTATPFRDR